MCSHHGVLILCQEHASVNDADALLNRSVTAQTDVGVMCATFSSKLTKYRLFNTQTRQKLTKLLIEGAAAEYH